MKFIKELAAYEQMENEVIATENDVLETIFCDKPYAKALILEYDT